jgi:hypothetical protein
MQVLLLRGVFSVQNGALWVEDEIQGPLQVDEALKPFRNRMVNLALHHIPPQGNQSPCCFPDGKGCPLSHDVFPDRRLALHLQGRLMQSPWKIRLPDAGDVLLPLSALPGHYGALHCVTQVVTRDTDRGSLHHEVRALTDLLHKIRGPLS